MEIPINFREWWNNFSEDEQIWKMMCYGFEKFNPNNLTSQQIELIYRMEYKKM